MATSRENPRPPTWVSRWPLTQKLRDVPGPARSVLHTPDCVEAPHHEAVGRVSPTCGNSPMSL